MTDDQMVFLHCGGLDSRKGTLRILEALLNVEDDRAKRAYVFAGKVYSGIRRRFYELLEKVRLRHSVIVLDRFCSYSEFCNLFFSSDCVLLPYSNVHQSSGIIAYAAKFGCPVVVTRDSMLYKIVRRYGLGEGLPDTTPAGLARFISNYVGKDGGRCSPNEYVNTHRIGDFCDGIANFIEA